jgi:hypothetical protein
MAICRGVAPSTTCGAAPEDLPRSNRGGLVSGVAWLVPRDWLAPARPAQQLQLNETYGTSSADDEPPRAFMRCFIRRREDGRPLGSQRNTICRRHYARAVVRDLRCCWRPSQSSEPRTLSSPPDPYRTLGKGSNASRRDVEWPPDASSERGETDRSQSDQLRDGLAILTSRL